MSAQTHHNLQGEFAASLLDPAPSIPDVIGQAHAQAADKRFAVYRNNVTVSLIGALAARFPVTQRIVGEEFFWAMARLFVRANPPRSAVLMFYGDTFPAFIEEFAPAADLPYLAEVAELEAARTRAFHAADKTPADLSELALADEASLAGLRVVKHPAAEIVRGRYPIVRIWEMNAGKRELTAIEDWSAEEALVVRPHLDVQVRLLPAGGADFIGKLFAGASLEEAAEFAANGTSGFDLIANLAELIASGAVGGIVFPTGGSS